MIVKTEAIQEASKILGSMFPTSFVTLYYEHTLVSYEDVNDTDTDYDEHLKSE